MRFLSYLTMLLMAVVLSACGGGGGSPGLTSGSTPPTPTALFTTVPSAGVTLATGSSNGFAIGGGTSPYLATSSNAAVAVATISGTGLVVSGLSGGAATIEVRDSAGATKTIAVTVTTPTVTPPIAMFTTAPSSFNIPNGATHGYAINGGFPPYTVTSDDVSVVRATISGSALAVSAVGGGRANLTIKDSIGTSTIALAVTVGSSTSLFVTAPNNVNVSPGTTATYFITGGTAPYSVVSSDDRIVRTSIAGSAVTVTAVSVGNGSIQIKDAAGITLSFTVTVGGGAKFFINAPATVTMSPGTSANYSISGGTAPFSVVSDDARVVSGSVTGSTLNVAALSVGSGSLQIADASGSVLKLGVTVAAPTKFFINAPGAVVMSPGTSAAYVLAGGASPYSVISSDARVASASIVGTTLTVSALTTGAATLQINDAIGSPLTLGVTVSAPVGGAASQDPVLKLPLLKDASGAVTNSLSASGNTLLTVTLTDPSGFGIPNQVIDVTGDATQVIFPEGSAGLTNSLGVATIKVARASLLASGAGALTLTYSYKVGSFTTYPNGMAPPAANKVITTFIGYQLSASNITLTNLDIGATTLPAYGTRQVSVQANINGVPATGTQVQINFAATCGQISPVTAATNSSGIATVSYTATDAVGTVGSTLGCSGKSVEISASTVGATVVTKTLNVLAAPATNLSFVSATPTRIYLDGAGGPTQSIVVFKLVNARDEAILGQDVTLTLKTLNGGIPKASIGSVGSLAAVRLTTDGLGRVSVPVFSGTVPTNVIVNAALVSNALVQTDSATLTIASGRPAQLRVSLAIKDRAIRGFNFDGGETTVTLSLADRQGNPVPDGTAINFVTEGGVMIPPVCNTGVAPGVPGDSQCTVKIRTQNPRPANGLVSILAYASGEEDFVDANFNNVYDCGETYSDLGTAYRDDSQTALGTVNAFVTGAFSVPRVASPSACATGNTPSPSTGDGVWGAADVRMQTTIVFSTDDLTMAAPTWFSAADASWTGQAITTQLSVLIQDLNGNSVPSGSTIAVAATDASLKFPVTFDTSIPPAPSYGTCAVTGQSHVAVPNTLSPLPLSVYLKECVTGDQVKITVTTPAGVKAITFAVP